ncbi:unnamed protein product [Effrenium voratum]|nr:unnamed protein product [Effrenium voratum]
MCLPEPWSREIKECQAFRPVLAKYRRKRHAPGAGLRCALRQLTLRQGQKRGRADAVLFGPPDNPKRAASGSPARQHLAKAVRRERPAAGVRVVQGAMFLSDSLVPHRR